MKKIILILVFLLAACSDPIVVDVYKIRIVCENACQLVSGNYIGFEGSVKQLSQNKPICTCRIACNQNHQDCETGYRFVKVFGDK